MAANPLIVTGAVWANTAKSWLVQHRSALTALALVLFLAGSVWSFLALDLAVSGLNLAALAILTLAMGFVTLFHSAVSLALLARTGGVRLGLADAMRAAARAQIAEALPLPGGAIVRSATLVAAGCSPARSVALVVGTALLWIALATTAAGAIMIQTAPAAGWTMLAGGLFVSGGALAHVVSLAGLTNGFLTLLLRILGLAFGAVRLWLSFAVIKVAMPIAATFPYVLAAIAGSASSLVPGGLGVSEALGALMAQALGSAPQAAFLAVAINRLTQFLGTAVIAPFLEFPAIARRRQAAHD